jgi:hypothetical protein
LFLFLHTFIFLYTFLFELLELLFELFELVSGINKHEFIDFISDSVKFLSSVSISRFTLSKEEYVIISGTLFFIIEYFSSGSFDVVRARFLTFFFLVEELKYRDLFSSILNSIF